MTKPHEGPPKIRFAGTYRLRDKAGCGSFGDLYRATNIITGENLVIKLEPIGSADPQLENEFDIYTALGGQFGFPRIEWFGIEGSHYGLVMEQLGPSLQMKFEECDYKFSLPTVLRIADQLINRIEFLHSRNIIHCDIKPENIFLGIGDMQESLYLIDFGLARLSSLDTMRPGLKLYDPDHSDVSSTIVGTPRYASIHAHRGLALGRRDDLESFMYVLIYFLRGSLPWQGIDEGTKIDRYRRILRMKVNTLPNKLCLNLPREFTLLLEYVRALSFEDDPDYTYIRKILRSLRSRLLLPRLKHFGWSVTHSSTSAVGDPAPDMLARTQPRASTAASPPKEPGFTRIRHSGL